VATAVAGGLGVGVETHSETQRSPCQMGACAGHSHLATHIITHGIIADESQVRSHAEPHSVQTLPPVQRCSDCENVAASSASSSSIRLWLTIANDMPVGGGESDASFSTSVCVHDCS